MQPVYSDDEDEIVPSSESTNTGCSAATLDNDVVQENPTNHSEDVPVSTPLDTDVSENQGDNMVSNETGMDDAIMSDPPASSPTPDAQSNTNRRLTIAALCNPNDEDPYIRPPPASEPIDQNLETNHLPSWVKGCKCEQPLI